MDKIQLFVAGTISVVALLILISRLFYPNIIQLDEISLVLLGVAILPWLTLFFKKIKLPGGVEVESNRQQGSTRKPVPPIETNELRKLDTKGLPRFSKLNSHTKKILKSLWKYQKDLYKDNYAIRWTFTVFHKAEEYSSYVIGLGELLDLGIVSLVKDEKTAQCMLTNEGIKFCEDNADEIGKYESYYKF